jgi:hypothetical protein
MNEELIKKLSYDAQNYAHEQNDKYGVSYIQAFESKFAELIIKETLIVARAGMQFGPSMEEAVYTYFGVEE